MPLEQRQPDAGSHFLGEHRLAGAGLTLDEQRPLQGDGRIDGELQVIGSNIRGGAFELHRVPGLECETLKTGSLVGEG
jgi:hypothetical protein